MSRASADRVRLLVVEDDVTNRLLVRAVLSRAADQRIATAAVSEAPTLAEARSMLDQATPDVIVLDVRHTDGIGLDLARELARRPSGERPRVLIMSASVLPQERHEAMAAGCDAFLAKPFRPGELIDLLGTWLAA